MGSPSPAATKVKRESPTPRAGPHRRTSSVTSSCVSLESGDQDALYSPARSTGPGKSPVATSVSSPRTPAGVNPAEKSVSPAAMKKRRFSIGGSTDDLARGLDFSTSSASPVNEEKKLHSFLTKGGGHKKVVPSASVTAQASSPGKKMGTTPPGKEKQLVAVRATSASVLSPRKLSDGREISKKDISSSQKPVSASEGSSTNGITTANSELGNNVEQVTTKKSSPLRVSLDGKIGKSSPRLNTKSKSELASTKGRTNSNGELAAVDSSVEAKIKTDYKFSPGVSPDGKIGKKSSPRPTLKSKSSLTSSTGRKLTKSRQDTSSPPQPGRVRTRNDKAARNEELSRPEMESVEVPVYTEYEYDREAKSENVVIMSHKMLTPLQHDGADEERSTLLASLMIGGNVGDEDMSSLEHGGEPGFDKDTELPTSWLSEDLPCMFSSLSHLPEPDESSSSLLGDPPVVLDEPFQRSSNENLLAVPNVIIAAEISRSVVVSSPKSPVSTMDEIFFSVNDPSEVSHGVNQLAEDESTWNYESNSFSNMVDDPVDKFEAELFTQIDATYERESPQLSVPLVEDPVDKFEAELRTQIDTTFESPQLSVPPVRQEYVVRPVAITKSLLTVDKGETMPYKFTTHPEDISSSTSDNESSVSESVANESFLQSCTSQVTENMLTGGGQSQPISSQIVEGPTEVSKAVPTFLEGDKEIFQLDPPSCANHMISVPDAKPSLQEEGRRPTVEDEISTNHRCPDQHVVESSDDEFLEEIIEGSDSAQQNLKQSFDDVAEPLAVSRSSVEEIDISHANIVSIVPVLMVSPREDTSDNALEQYAIGPQELALSTESEFAAEFLDGQDCGAFTPTYLDQDMKIFEEYWTLSVTDESSQSDAGQNDAKDLQPSTLSETELLNTVEDEAEKSLPPIELPVSILPVVGKLKLTVEESINLEPPGQHSAEVGATKLEIVDVIEEILPREGWPCPDSTVSVPASDNYQVDTESANQEQVEEFDEVFHFFGGSEELSTSVILFDNLSSPSRPDVLPEELNQGPLNPTLSESFEETRFENANESEFSSSPRCNTSALGIDHPHVVDSTPVVLDLQNIDVEGVTEHQDFSIKFFAEQDASVDDLLHDPHHASISGALDGPADQELTHEDLATPPIFAINSNDLVVNIQYLDDDEASDESLTSEHPDLPIEDPDLSLGTTIQDASHKSSFETPAVSETHMAVQSNEVCELGPENPSMLLGLEFCANSVQTAGEGDKNTARTDDDESLMSEDCIFKINNSQGSPDRDFSGPIVQVAAETDDSHDLDSKISPKLPMMEGNQTIFVSPQSSASAGAATKEVNPPESNALFPPVGGVNDEEQTEANFLSSLDKEEESPYGAIQSEGHANGTASLGERQERIENSIPGLEVQMDFDQEEPQGRLNSTEGAESINNYSGCIPTSELLTNSIELDMVIPATEATINYSDSTASSTEILEKDEAIHVVAVAPFVLSAKELPNTTLNEDGEFDSLESEVNEETPLNGDDSKLGIVDCGEQRSAELDWEGPLLTADSSGSKSITEDKWDLLREDSMFTNASSSAAADARSDTAKDPEIDEDNSEEASSIFTTSVSTPSELIEYHDPNLQETQLRLGTLISSDDQVSRTEDAPEIEKASMTLLDADLDEDLSEPALDDHVINDIENIPENFSSQDLALKLYVTPSQDIPNAEILDVDDMKKDSDFYWKGDKEGESLNGILEQNRLPNDVDTVVDSAENFFVASDQDTAINVDVDEREEISSFRRRTETEKVYFCDRLEEEPLFEDEETVVFGPKNLYVNASGPDTQILGANDIGNDSSISWTTGNDEESLNGSVEEESLLEDGDTVVYSPKHTSDATILGANDIQNHSAVSWKADNDKDYLNDSVEENTFLKDEDMAVDSSKKLFVVSGQNTATLDVDEMEEHSNSSWTAGKKEENVNGSLERDSVLEDEEMAVPSLKDPFNVSEQETPDTMIASVSDIQNHSNNSWTADKDELESLNGTLEEESLLEDEDTVVYRPMESLDISGQDLPDTPLLVDKMEGLLKLPEKADKEGKSLNGIVIEEAVPEVEKAMPEVMNAIPEVDNSMPEVEEAIPEVQETMVDNHEEALAVQNNTNAEALIVDDVEKRATWRDDKEEEESLDYGNILEKESIVQVQEMVDHSLTESFIALDLPHANEENSDVDETGKHPTWRTDKEGDTLIRSLEEKSIFEVEETLVDSPKEALVVYDEDNKNAAISDVDVLEKQSTWTTDKEGEGLNRKLEDESMLEVEETVMDSSIGNAMNLLVCQVPEVNGALQSINCNTDYMGEDFVSHSRTEDGAMTLHESDEDAVHIATEAVRVENPIVVNANLVDEDSDLESFSRADVVVDCKSCVIPEMTNGNHLQESDCPHETAAVIETPVIALKTGASGLESNPQDIDSLEEATEPQSPEATLYPLLATQPPFSGSQQDRLWEEQAEAYSSGGRGTPSRNEDPTQAAAPFNPPSPPAEQPTSSDDQIQPASGPMNNGQAVAVPSNAGVNGSAPQYEPKGKGKLHTPLRSLLLEDASKSADGDSNTSNGVTSSPSFIRRLFRVMSTPSRTAEREVSQTKLKKSSSMWVSCLGSPQEGGLGEFRRPVSHAYYTAMAESETRKRAGHQSLRRLDSRAESRSVHTHEVVPNCTGSKSASTLDMKNLANAEKWTMNSERLVEAKRR